MDYPKFSDFNKAPMSEKDVHDKIDRESKNNQKEVQEAPESNPFDNEKYDDVEAPDEPIEYGNSMAESLLNNNEVPEELRENYWNVFHKDNVLTFLDEDRKNSKMMNMEIMKIDNMNTLGYNDFTFNKELEFNIIRNIFETKLDRALGFKSNNQKNERITLQSQFSENRNISEEGGNNMVKEGFFKRLLSRR